MSRPIVATSRATRGLRSTPPVRLADTPRAFARELLDIWASSDAGAELGRSARQWVERTHTWEATATEAVKGLAAPSGREA